MKKELDRYFNKGINALADGNWLSAVQFFKKCQEIDPSQIDAYLELSDIYYHNGQYDAALRELTAALLIEPDDEEAGFMLGRVYLSLSRHKDALRVFKRLEHDSTAFTPDIHYYLGMAYKQLGYPAEALDYFNMALGEDPSYYECLDEIGRIHFDAGRLDEALKAYQELVDADPGDITAHHMLGVIYSKQSMWKAAIDQLEIVLSLAPNMDEALRELGWALNMTGNFDSSVNALKKAIDMNPSNLQARIDLGAVFMSNLRLEEAIKELEQAGRDDPGNPLIKKFLSDAHALRKSNEGKE